MFESKYQGASYSRKAINFELYWSSHTSDTSFGIQMAASPNAFINPYKKVWCIHVRNTLKILQPHIGFKSFWTELSEF